MSRKESNARYYAKNRERLCAEERARYLVRVGGKLKRGKMLQTPTGQSAASHGLGANSTE